MRFSRTMVLAAVVVLAGALCCADPYTDPIVNGDFSTPDLDGWGAWADMVWSLDPTNPTSPVYDGGGYAVLEEDNISGSLTLDQAFTIPALTQSLSFDYTINWSGTRPPGFYDPDALAASLLDPVTYAPIVSTPGFTDYFYHDNLDAVDYDPSIVTVSGDTVTVDLASVAADTDALLAFDLLLYDDGYFTQVTLDNVKLNPVPEPLSMAFLGSAFIGVVGYGLRKRRQARRT